MIHQTISFEILLAEVRKDVSGQFQIAMLLGDVEERVKLLRQCNQSNKTCTNSSVDLYFNLQ